jgi:hypothetical protein
MTTPDVPLPAPGDRDWTDWGAETEALTDLVRVHGTEITGRLSDVSLRAALVPFWAAGETVIAGTIRMSPDGETIERIADGTTGATYDATEAGAWTVVPPADATTTTKGVVQLAGDLGGTAAAPTVPGLAGKANTAHTHPVGDLTATGTRDATTVLYGDNTWKVPSGGGGFAGFVRPEDHGAVGDGVADDTTALQNAITALTTGKALYLSPGRRYTHSAVLTFATDGTGVIGGGTLLATAEATSAVKFTGDNIFAADVTFELATSTARFDPYEYQKVLLDGANGFVGINLRSKNSSATGYFITRTDGFTLICCEIDLSRADGFHVTGGSKSGLVLFPVSRRPGDDGFAVVSYTGGSDPGLCENIAITGPQVYDQTARGRGVAVVGGKNVIYRDIFVDRSWGPGVYFGCEPYGGNPTYGVDGARVSGGIIRRAHSTSDIGNGAILVASSRSGEVIANSTIENLDVFDTARDRASALPFEIGAYTENGGLVSNLLMRHIRATNGNATGTLLYSPLSTSDFTRHDLTRVTEPVTTLAADDFNRADATTLGTAPTGQTWAGDAFSISSTAARGNGHAYVDVGQVDMDVEAMTIWDGTTGVLGVQTNLLDASNRLVLWLDGGTPNLGKVDAGTLTVFWSGTAVTVGAGVKHRLRLRSEVTQLKAYLNGSLLTTYTLTGAEQTKYKGAGYTNAGLRANGTTVGSLDDFAVSPLAA